MKRQSRIGLLTLAFAFSIGTCAAAILIKPNDVEQVKADGPVFRIDNQDMLTNTTFIGNGGGTAVLTRNAEDDYILTFTNFVHSSTGASTSTAGGYAVIFIENITSNYIYFNLIGTNTITNTRNDCQFAEVINTQSARLTIQTDELESDKATLNLIQTGNQSDSRGLLAYGPTGFTEFKNCIINAASGDTVNSGNSYAIWAQYALIYAGAEITAVGGTAKWESVGFYGDTFTMYGGSLNATAGDTISGANSRSVGLRALGAEQRGGTIVARGGYAPESQSAGVQAFGYPTNGYTIKGGSLTAIGGVSGSGESYGIYTYHSGQYVLKLQTNPSRVSLQGNTQAIKDNFVVSNQFEGRGYDSLSNYENCELITINTTNHSLESPYKRVEFGGSDASVSVTPVKADDFNYDGSDHDLLSNPGTAVGGTLKYRVNDEDYSTSVPQAKEAGSYHIYYKVIGDFDHFSTTEIDLGTVTIGKADSTLVAPTGKTNLVYTGEEQNLLNSIGSATGGQIYYKVDDGAYSPAQPKATTAGDHTVYYKVVGDTNHNDYPESYLVVNIAKANPSYVAPTGKTGLAYNGTSQALLETAGSCDYGTIQYRVGTLGWYSDAIPEVIAAGDYDVYYEIVSTNSNYNSLTDLGPIHVSIAKADPVFTAPVGKSSLFIYNGNPQELLQSAGSATGGTIYYKVNDGEYSTDLPTATNAGDYTVYYKVVGDSNHNDIAESSLSVHLREANLVAYSVSQEGTLTYNGSPQVATVSESVKVTGHQPTTFHYSTSEEGPWSDSVPAFTNAGDHTVYCYISAPNHFDTPVFSFTVTINKADSTLVAPTGKTNLVYTGEEQNLLNSIGSATGGQIYYKVDDGAYSPAQPKATTAGNHTVYYKVVGDSNHNNIDESSFSVIIGEASLSDVSVSATSAPYTGSALTPSVTANATTVDSSPVTFTYSTTSGGVYGALPTFTDAGTHTIYYKANAENHSEATGNFTFTINKVDPDYVAPTAIDGLVYTGSSQILINAGSTSTGTLVYRLGETGEFSTTLPAATEAGTYTIYYKVLGDENHNDSEIQSVVVTVALTPSTPEPGTPTNGEPKSFPVWAIVVILVGGVLLVFGLLLLLFFFALSKWAIHNGKPVRVYKIGKKDDKIKLLTLGFKVILKDESEIFDSKVDALKLLK